MKSINYSAHFSTMKSINYNMNKNINLMKNVICYYSAAYLHVHKPQGCITAAAINMQQITLMINTP